MNPVMVGRRYGARVAPYASRRRVIQEIRLAVSPAARRDPLYRNCRHTAYRAGLVAHALVGMASTSP